MTKANNNKRIALPNILEIIFIKADDLLTINMYYQIKIKKASIINVSIVPTFSQSCLYLICLLRWLNHGR